MNQDNSIIHSKTLLEHVGEKNPLFPTLCIWFLFQRSKFFSWKNEDSVEEGREERRKGGREGEENRGRKEGREEGWMGEILIKNKSDNQL